MKLISRVLLLALALPVISGAAPARKMTEKAYITSAKIAIVSGDTTRYNKEAIVMLDSLLLNYGPHPEAYFWLNQMQADFIEKTPGLAGKEPHVKLMSVYRDSIKLACASESVKSKYKSDCKDFSEKADSTAVKYWRIFYNNGVAQYQAVQDAAKELSANTDSASTDFYKKKLNVNADSALTNMKLCVILDSTDDKAYLLAGTVLSQQNDFAASTDWLQRGLKYAKDSTAILSQIAYGEIQQNKYCDAIPYFKEYVKHTPSDTTTLTYLAICYNNCKMYDSAAMVDRQILQLDPKHQEALGGLGRYFNQMGLFANDSAGAYRDKSDEAGSKKWSEVRTQMFDSARTYFRQAFEANPTNTLAAEQYGDISLLTNDYQAAVQVFTKLTETNPTNRDYWVSLGDGYFYLKDFRKAATSYEKVVEIDPSDRQIWERLSDLYAELKEPAKAAEAQKHLK